MRPETPNPRDDLTDPERRLWATSAKDAIVPILDRRLFINTELFLAKRSLDCPINNELDRAQCRNWYYSAFAESALFSLEYKEIVVV